MILKIQTVHRHTHPRDKLFYICIVCSKLKMMITIQHEKVKKGKVHLYTGSDTIAAYAASASLSTQRAGAQPRPQPNPAVTDFG